MESWYVSCKLQPAIILQVCCHSQQGDDLSAVGNDLSAVWSRMRGRAMTKATRPPRQSFVSWSTMLSTAAARTACLAPRTVAVRTSRRSVAVRACK